MTRLIGGNFTPLCLALLPTLAGCAPLVDIAGEIHASLAGAPSSIGGAGGSLGSMGGNSSTGGSTSAPSGLPCDVLDMAGNLCVAAHSTVRLLSGNYGGPLYRVTRFDGAFTDIGVIGGYADAAAQDAFCAGSTCTVSTIYDQSQHQNDLTPAPAGGMKPTPGNPARATVLTVAINGHSVYGLKFSPGMGYRKLVGNGTPTGDQPETMYMVSSQKDLLNGCCFDYGNAETTANDDGNGTAEAVYVGSGVIWGSGSGTGPWVMADLENGLFAGWERGQDKQISTNTSVKYDFITAVVVGDTAEKNNGKGRFAIYGGDATSGTLKTMYDGMRPEKPGYVPMQKQGSIILSIAGDNSDADGGRFYEGVLARGAATKATVDALQASIVAAGYGAARGSNEAGGASGTGGAPATGGSTGNGGSGTCTSTSVTPCGGNLVGTWTVAPSCLTVSGNLDLTMLGLGCLSAPITGGTLNVTGTLTANADGSLSDNTTVVGYEQFMLPASCLNISGTSVVCNMLGTPLSIFGYTTVTCTEEASGGCSCTGMVHQDGGIGVVSSNPLTIGRYQTAGNSFTTSDGQFDTSYAYCVTGNEMNVTPQTTSPTTLGTIVLLKQ